MRQLEEVVGADNQSAGRGGDGDGETSYYNDGEVPYSYRNTNAHPPYPSSVRYIRRCVPNPNWYIEAHKRWEAREDANDENWWSEVMGL